MPYVQTEEDFLFQQVMINRLIDKKSKIRGSKISIVVMPDETNQKEFDYDDVIGRLSPEFFHKAIEAQVLLRKSIEKTHFSVY